MTWEVFTGAGPDIASAPRLSIRTGGELYLNAAADRAWFTDAEAVTILLDRQSIRLAVAPEDRGGRTYSLSRESHAGAQFGAGAPVRDMGIDPAALDGAQQLDLEWDADLDAAVADLSVLVDGVEDSEPEAVEADPVETDAGDDTGTPDTPCEGSDDAVETDTDQDTDDPRELVEAWVRQKAGTGHEYLLESREIAEHLPLSGPQVGQHLRYLRAEADDLLIEHESALENDDGDRGRWRLGLAETAETDGEGAPERRFGADKHEPADDPDGLSDGLLRDLASVEETVIGLSQAHPDLTIATARAANTRLGLGLDDERGYGSQWSDRGGESA